MTHLELEDLIATATGELASDQDHLAACRSCQAEVERWQLVADGQPVPTMPRRRLSTKIVSVVVALLLVISLSPEFVLWIR